MNKSTDKISTESDSVAGEFITVNAERYYAIRNVDRLKPFLTSVVSNDNHWLFISSTGGLSAGRVSPDTALFPYVTVDKLHECAAHTGSLTILRTQTEAGTQTWEPFRRIVGDTHQITRNIYKNLLANKLCFEETNHDLGLVFRYQWETSDGFGFVRYSELENLTDASIRVEFVDGLQNILPAGTQRNAQLNSSNLVDAYKWTELDKASGLAIYSLYSDMSDRAEPRESLRANTVFCLGLENQTTLISSTQLDDFRRGEELQQETHIRGVRGSYLVNKTLDLLPGASQKWQIVADIQKSQSQVAELQQQLLDPRDLETSLQHSVELGSKDLVRLMASADSFQISAEENVSAHHYANVLFNVLRGGVLDNQYKISAEDFIGCIKQFNDGVYQRNKDYLVGLPATLNITTLLDSVTKTGDLQLNRLAHDYLPVSFGRRHGDPSRPWNNFNILLRDNNNDQLLSYEGNWRDIFQNWEALLFSFPEYIENVIAKFVNASTMDGYNPYRISKKGIDWEIDDPEDPWSFIGYWGDHQIVYLTKLLELSTQFHPRHLRELLRSNVFCYANVPYKIKSFEAILDDSKNTVTYDHELAARIEKRVSLIGADGKLVLNSNGEVYQVNLLEKLLVPLLTKLGNVVIDGGVWLNTQRPEWNDANNALVGHGLSMVTMYYLRRHIYLLQTLLAQETDEFELSNEVSQWLSETAVAYVNIRAILGPEPVTPSQRLEALRALGSAASKYRDDVYRQTPYSGKTMQSLDSIRSLFDDALMTIDHCISTNKGVDGLYHAYNLLERQADGLSVQRLYPMLEGQVAALSAGSIAPQEACAILEALFESAIYRKDQKSFMLYPDRDLPGFLEKNRIPSSEIESIPLLTQMLLKDDKRILEQDVSGCYRFNADFHNARDLNHQLDQLESEYGEQLSASRQPLQTLYEKVFNHLSFTGRSGTMFGFEGLGCIYWHMVAKLLLAVQENFFAAIDQDADAAICEQLGRLYYRVRDGIGFNKTPYEYGAFPLDPYSHTPKHAGARQPGMTGQVKEEILSRFGELGVRVSHGAVRFKPRLLRTQEFLTETREFHFINVNGDKDHLSVPLAGLAFTWCQVPVVYELGDEDSGTSLTITWDNGEQQKFDQLAIPAKESSELFKRNGRIRHLKLNFGAEQLFA